MDVFVFVEIFILWNKITGSDPGTRLGTTVLCSLCYPKRALYGISEDCNEYEHNWYHRWIFTWISINNIGKKLRRIKWFHIWWFGTWVTCRINIWTCTRHQIWTFTWIIYWHVYLKWRWICRIISQWQDTRLHWRTNEYNTDQQRWKISGCLWWWNMTGLHKWLSSGKSWRIPNVSTCWCMTWTITDKYVEFLIRKRLGSSKLYV